MSNQDSLNEFQSIQNKLDSCKIIIEDLKQDLRYQEELILRKDSYIDVLKEEIIIQKKKNLELIKMIPTSKV